MGSARRALRPRRSSGRSLRASAAHVDTVPRCSRSFSAPWDAMTGEHRFTANSHSGGVGGSTGAPMGPGWRRRARIEARGGGEVRWLDMSGDRQPFATASFEGLVRVRDASTGEDRFTVPLFPVGVWPWVSSGALMAGGWPSSSTVKSEVTWSSSIARGRGGQTRRSAGAVRRIGKLQPGRPPAGDHAARHRAQESGEHGGDDLGLGARRGRGHCRHRCRTCGVRPDRRADRHQSLPRRGSPTSASSPRSMR